MHYKSFAQVIIIDTCILHKQIVIYKFFKLHAKCINNVLNFQIFKSSTETKTFHFF